MLQMQVMESDEPFQGRGADDESDEETDETADSLPDLEDIPVPGDMRGGEDEEPAVHRPVQHSLAATVEDEHDEDEEGQSNVAEPGRLGPRPHPPPTHQIFAPRDPEDRSLPVNRAASTVPDSNDTQRVQRWLISTGLQDLQSDNGKLGEYVNKLKALRQRDRDWTVGIVKQRAGAELANRVKRELEI